MVACRYRYNGKELNEDLGLYDYGARWYDPAIAKWNAVDLLADQYSSWSPYNYVLGNPISLIDPDGRSVESTHVDEVGTIIVEYDDGDDGVYVHNSETTKQDVDKQRQNAQNTGGDGEYIGDLGGTIDITKIYANLLKQNMAEADGMWNPFTFRDLVKNGGDWDLKNNNSTIYGLGNDGETTFTFGTTMESQDIGNHHFGAVAKEFGFPLITSLIQAGKAQIEAGTSRPEWQPSKAGRGGRRVLQEPYGDDPRDQKWIKSGYQYAPKK